MSELSRLDILCYRALGKWDNDTQLLKAVSELTELSLELQQLRYGKPTDIPQEIADCYIMLRQLVIMFNLEDNLDDIVNSKLDKLERILDDNV